MSVSIRLFQRFLLIDLLGNGFQSYGLGLSFNNLINVLFELVLYSERSFEKPIVNESSIYKQVVDYIGDIDEDFTVIFKVNTPRSIRISAIFFGVDDADLYDQEYGVHDINGSHQEHNEYFGCGK